MQVPRKLSPELEHMHMPDFHSINVNEAPPRAVPMPEAPPMVLEDAPPRTISHEKFDVYWRNVNAVLDRIDIKRWARVVWPTLMLGGWSNWPEPYRSAIWEVLEQRLADTSLRTACVLWLLSNPNRTLGEDSIVRAYLYTCGTLAVADLIKRCLWSQDRDGTYKLDGIIPGVGDGNA